jgi:HEAT repeat protein
VAPRIIPLLDDKCAGVRLAAVVALSQLRQNPDQAIPALVRLLQDPNGLIRVYSVTLLDGMASRTQIVPELIRALQDSDAGPPPAAPRASVPRFSTRGLIDSGTNADPKAPSLGRGASGIPTSPRGRTLLPPGMSLGSSRVAVRGNAATALGHIGPAARAAVPELTKLLRDPDPFVRQQSAIALWRIDGATHVVPLIVAELQSPENPPTWNRALLKVLGEMGSAAKPARAAVLKLSREEAEVGSGFKVSAEVSALAREVLAKIGTDP